MSRTLVRSLLSLSVLLPFRSAASQPATNPEVAAVRAALVAMWAAVEAGDSAGYARHVHPDFTQFGENDVYLAKGRDLELRSMGAYLRRAKEVHTDMHQAEVIVRGGVAWITYYWTDSGQSDGKRFTSRGKSTRIFVKEGDRWLCIHGHYTAVP